VRDDLNCDFRRVGFLGVVNVSIGVDSEEGISIEEGRISSSDSSGIWRGSFSMTCSRGGESARVSRNEADEGGDSEDMVDEDLEPLKRGGVKGEKS
jgi:hypothetical protein